MHQDLDGRRAVRGCSVGETCTSPDDVLREFQAEHIPPPGDNPWISERTPPRSALEATHPKVVRHPSELRPDAPWLDKLALPDIPIHWSKRLVEYLVFYHDDPRGRALMQMWLVAQGRYRDMIVEQLRKAHLPEDLVYLAMIESGYDPTIRSRAGAVGLWQFMPRTGSIYGLRRDRWVDERRDPYRSTVAEMDALKDLYQRFGEWHIALAAYNAGYAGILRSIARYNTNDYYQLCQYENALGWENCWYTPKIIAAAIVGRNRKAFGFDKLKVEPAEEWDTITVPTSISLAIIARAAGTDTATIQRLNPHLIRGRTPPEPGYVVRVPRGSKADARRRLVDLQTQWDGYDAYVVSHGERLEDIATTFGMSYAALRKLNDVTDEAEITGGAVLVVPRISAAQREKNRAKARENLHQSGFDQKDGEPLIVPVPDKDAKVPGKKRVFYRVVSGDTLYDLGKAFDVTVAQLAAWNSLASTGKLHPRMVLMVWVDPAFDPTKHSVVLLDDSQILVVTRNSPEFLDLQEQRRGRVRVEYTVTRAKEKLSDIARRYGMGSHDLARINRISYNTVLSKGDKIVVYRVIDPKRSDRAKKQWRKTSARVRRKPRPTAEGVPVTDPTQVQ